MIEFLLECLVERIVNERGFPAPRDTGDDREDAERDLDIDIL